MRLFLRTLLGILPVFVLCLSLSAAAEATPLDEDRAADLLLHALREQSEAMQAAGVKPVIRYDGNGETNGIPCLFFAFGEDSPEKLTVVGHYAVDTHGRLYKMDIADEGKYKPLDTGED